MTAEYGKLISYLLPDGVWPGTNCFHLILRLLKWNFSITGVMLKLGALFIEKCFEMATWNVWEMRITIVAIILVLVL